MNTLAEAGKVSEQDNQFERFLSYADRQYSK